MINSDCTHYMVSMYDTIKSWIDRSGDGGIDASVCSLVDSKEIVDRSTGEVWVCGNVGNLKVAVSGMGMSVKGSLSKFYLTDNIYTLNRNQVKEAVEKLSDTLKVDFSTAKINRIDISANLIMHNQVAQYYDALGLCTYFNRVRATQDTLYYYNKGKEQKRTLVFYDKIREMQSRKCIIPEELRDRNILRYESRWNTRLSQQLKENEITGESLYDERFYNKIVDLWGDSYFKINKLRNVNNNAMGEIKTVSNALDFIFAMQLRKSDPNEIQKILEEMKEKKIFHDRKYYSRLKAKLKEISSKIDYTSEIDLVQELDSKVRNVLDHKH